MRITAALLLTMMATTSAWGQSPRWANDRGEDASAEQLLTLGEDGIDTIGPATGPPLQGPALAARTEALASEIRCPVCQGQSVQASTAEAARNMKAQIEALVAAGYSDEEVLRYFEASYGEFIRMMPRAEGFNLLVWIIPALALLLGALATWRTIRRLGVEQPGQGSQSTPKGQLKAASLSTEEKELGPWIEQIRTELESGHG